MEKNRWEDVPTQPSGCHVQSKEYGVPPKSQSEVLQSISKAHIDSFNFVLRQGLGKAVQNISPVVMELPNKSRLEFRIKDAIVGRPIIHKDSVGADTLSIYPAECRLRAITYRAQLELTIAWSLKERVQEDIYKVVGHIPIMVKSDACNLKSLSPAELIKHGEEEQELGGYFIVDGKERIIRFLINQRRNYPVALKRPSWEKQGKLFTQYGITIRCTRPDQTSNPMFLNYLSDGSAMVTFFINQERFTLSVVMLLKALCDVQDYEIYTELTKGKDDDFFKGCIVNMLRSLQKKDLLCHSQIRNFIGETFRVKLRLPEWYSNNEVTKFLLKKYICVHLDSDFDKFNLIVFMTRKLYALAKDECAIESSDNPMNHEVLLSGHVYLIVLKQHLESWLNTVQLSIGAIMKRKGASYKFDINTMKEAIRRSGDITTRIENFLKTGNFLARDMSLSQRNGFCIVAEKLNFWRFASHFRCVHRGQYFAQMRTTAVRKLLPEAWGFLCPVHTPDGAPCGLLNHMTAMCEITNVQPPIGHIPGLLTSIGMFPYADLLPYPIYSYKDCYCVLLDGRVLGWIYKGLISKILTELRYLKSSEDKRIPPTLEIGFVPMTDSASQYPGLFLFSTPSRMMRPVRSFYTQGIEMLGTMEQVYLHIPLESSEIIEGETMHQELRDTCILGIIANMIPFSDFNPSPRNMYECQMGKQTMGTPCHALPYRADTKLYRLQTPQSPIVRPALYDHYQMDDYPLGTNAIVAVMSYTGFDMEDAIVLNKASVERGFKHGSMYKSEIINLRTIDSDHGTQISYVFGRKATDEKLKNFIDVDGLPYIGTKLEFGDPVCSYISLATADTVCHKYKSTDIAYIHDVKLLGNDTGTDRLQKICVTYWIPRNPIIGDKFASRHGQKGVCSYFLPQEDMPFTESGMVPDIIFNPHGFPSRMTIGMMIESMAGKSGALHGVIHDATPFTFSEGQPASDYFAHCLELAGYNYHGTERMYSGTGGRELEADIFFGVVYYQRLRHMVADKFQVRTTGPIDRITHQPVKGRKNDGGVRFGEMERDSLLAHGASFLLHDRLMNCSDKSQAHVCAKCQSILSPYHLPFFKERKGDWVCKTCGSKRDIEIIDIPYVFRYLVAELASVNVAVKLELEKTIEEKYAIEKK